MILLYGKQDCVIRIFDEVIPMGNLDEAISISEVPDNKCNKRSMN